jgi:soluble lytic murein transglycosylase-like protein
MMRRLNTSTTLFAALLLAQPVLAEGEPDKPAVAQTAVQPSGAGTSAQPSEPEAPAQSPGGPAEAAQPAAPDQSAAKPAEAPASQAVSAAPSNAPAEGRRQQPTRDEICQLIESAATGEALPVEFFARLIWQESRFNPQAVSPAGALGIAQFMPKTANGRGLSDPFEPVSALQESAEFLRELVQKFGNVGLAAAAYNAGPKRVNDWLAKRGALPRETQNYVQIITGRSAEKWASAEAPVSEPSQDFQCNEIAKLVAQRRGGAALERLARAVVLRLSYERGDAAATLAARRAVRSGVLGKRAAPPAPAGDEAASSPAQRHGVRRIIKITARENGRARVQVVNVALTTRRDMRMDAAKHDMRKDNVAKLDDKRGNARDVRVAANASKGRRGAISEGRASNVSGAARRSLPSGKVRVAVSSATAEKSCSHAKTGGRKPCRQA